MPQLLLLCLSTSINNKPAECQSVIDNTSSKFSWRCGVRFIIGYAYFNYISVTVILFQLQLQLLRANLHVAEVSCQGGMPSRQADVTRQQAAIQALHAVGLSHAWFKT